MKPFDPVTYSEISTLISIVKKYPKSDIEFIQSRYANFSNNFQNVKNFCIELKVITDTDDSLKLTSALAKTTNKQITSTILKPILLHHLFIANGEVSKTLRDYLNNFVTENNFIYKPNTSTRLKESAIRNLLIELGFLNHDTEKDVYEISDNYMNKLELYLYKKGMTPKQLDILLKNKSELGLSAELEIMKLEQERLSDYPRLLKKLKHIALEDVSAGFDILSWETNTDSDNIKPRYIEVKAISDDNVGFYLSRNEIEKAKKLGDEYFLYLLPMGNTGSFDLSNLQTIPNPISELNNSDKWKSQIETYNFKKNEHI